MSSETSERETRREELERMYDLMNELYVKHDADNAVLRPTEYGPEIALQFHIPELAGGNDGE
jgi:hypothetical protein